MPQIPANLKNIVAVDELPSHKRRLFANRKAAIAAAFL
jgi:hypothetical protein